MRRWRWDLIVMALVVALGLLAHAMLPRYTSAGDRVLDRWTGRYCNGRGHCW
jgi:hypothetical protein